jgi:hypothetical protein
MAFRITFSNSFPVVDRRLIGRKFWRHFRSLPGFGKVIIFASFQEFGKWDNLKQWLNRWVKCTNGLLERCLRHSFGMPWIPQAFFNFNDFIIFYTWHGQTLWGWVVSSVWSRVWTWASTRVHGFRHTDHVVWPEFPKCQQLRWLYRTDEIWGLKHHEWQLVPLVHPSKGGISQWTIWPEVWLQYYLFLSPTVQVPFFGSFEWLLSWPN